MVNKNQGVSESRICKWPEDNMVPLRRVGMAILSMDLNIHGYPTRLGKGMERICAHGSLDMDTHEQSGWAYF